MKNEAAVALGKLSWDARRKSIDNPSEYFSKLKKGKTKMAKIKAKKNIVDKS